MAANLSKTGEACKLTGPGASTAPNTRNTKKTALKHTGVLRAGDKERILKAAGGEKHVMGRETQDGQLRGTNSGWETGEPASRAPREENPSASRSTRGDVSVQNEVEKRLFGHPSRKDSPPKPHHNDAEGNPSHGKKIAPHGKIHTRNEEDKKETLKPLKIFKNNRLCKAKILC